LRSENVKRLKAVAIRPDRSVVQITGENGNGKTSVLDSIFWALGGTKGHGSLPIRQGEQKATIRLNLGEVTVIRRFTPSGTSLDVEAPNGARFKSPQTLLDEMLGALTFDPLAFARLAPKAQLEQLRGLVPLDVDLDALDERWQRAFAARTDVNRTVRSLAERVASLAADVDETMDVEPIDLAAMLDQMERAADHNSTVARATSDREAVRQGIAARRQSAAMRREQAARLLAEAEELENMAASQEAMLASAAPIPEPVDTALLRIAIDDARAKNAKREAQLRARSLYATARSEHEKALAEAKPLTDVIERSHAEKRDAIARAAMPIEGLSFGDGEILYRGVPFAQASSAEQLRVATAIGMALNPKLRILCIRDGSLLDTKSLALLEEMAAAHDFQVWIERVAEDPGVGIHLVDGAVAAVNGEPVQPELAEEAVA
jgi:predicted ATPase